MPLRLSTLKLVNFQAHKALEVELAPTITTIRGATDKGKSAIIRALRWLCLNDISGDEFIKEGTKRTEVSVCFNTGKDKPDYHDVVRAKSLGGVTNTYELDGEIYKSFSTSVPDDIRGLLKLSDINFQSQHDAPFWFTETAGEVSRRLNAVIDLSVIDGALYWTASELRRRQERKAVCEERLTSLQEELKTVQDVDKRIQAFEELEEKKDRYEQAQDHYDRLDALLSALRSNQARTLDEKASAGEEVLRKAGRYLKHARQYDALSELIEEVEEVSQLKGPPPDLSSVAGALDRYRLIAEEITSLDALLEDLKVATSQKAQAEGEATLAETLFRQKTKNTRCFVCGNLIQ